MKLSSHHLGSSCSADFNHFELDNATSEFLKESKEKTWSGCYRGDRTSEALSAGILRQVTSEISDESEELEMCPVNASG